MFKNVFVRYLTAAILILVILTLFVSGPVFAFSNSFGSKNNTTFIEPFDKNPPSWITNGGTEPWWKNIFDKKTGFDGWGSDGGTSGNKWW